MNVKSFNQKFAEKITSGVATMWCAYGFAALAILSLPSAIRSKDLLVIVAWIAQTFLQLVLLSIIMVGQKASSEAIAQQISETHAASLAEFKYAREARENSQEELKELRLIAGEMHLLLRDVRKR